MEIKILQVFYDKNGLPYKDKERTVHYPITSGTFLGASNTTQIRFYYDQLDELNERTFVAVSKLPNGKIGSEILENEYDSELEENYAVLNLSQFYTQYKGDVYISLQGYQGGVRVEQDENGIYQIYGTPTIQATGSIKLSIAYAPTFIGSGETENVNFQRVLAELSTKLGIRQETLHVEELPTVGNPNVWYVVNDDPNDANKANIYIWNATTQTYVWVGDNTLDLGNYYTNEQGEQFEEGIDNRVTSVENELSSLASGSPKGVYATLSDLESAYPTGAEGIYVVSADGHWYYWNGSAWTDGGVYLSTVNAVPDTRKVGMFALSQDIARDDIVEDLSSNLVKANAYNFFNKDDENNIMNAYIDSETGEITQDSSYSNIFVSHFIKCIPGQTIMWRCNSSYISPRLSIAFFQQDKETNISIGAIVGFDTDHFIVVAPANARWFRITGLIGALQTTNVLINRTWESDYVPFNGYFENNIKTKTLTPEKMSFMNALFVNLFDKDANGIINGKFLNPDGTITSANTFDISDYIEVKEGDILCCQDAAVFNTNYAGNYYDENKDFLANAPANQGTINGILCCYYTVPTGAKYIRVNIYNTNISLSQYMLVPNTFYNEYHPYNTFKYKADYEEIDFGNKETPQQTDKYNYIYQAKMISFGDSIAQGAGWTGGYAKAIGEKYEMTFHNYAISGSTVTPNRKYNATTPLGCISTTVNSTTPTFTPDFVILEGGINDWTCAHGSLAQYNTDFVFGTYNMKDYNVSHLDTTTFCGAFEYMLSRALEKWQNARFIFVLVHKWATIYAENDAEYNTEADWYNYWIPKIKDMCNKWGIPVVDLNKNCPPLGFVSSYKTAYTTGDGLHPNEAGYKYYYCPEIEKEMVRWLEYDS